jgi:hypothetical protein
MKTAAQIIAEGIVGIAGILICSACFITVVQMLKETANEEKKDLP